MFIASLFKSHYFLTTYVIFNALFFFQVYVLPIAMNPILQELNSFITSMGNLGNKGFFVLSLQQLHPGALPHPILVMFQTAPSGHARNYHPPLITDNLPFVQ